MVTAPYSDAAMLTLTGEVDFRHSVGRAQAVTSFSDDRPDDTRTLFFTAEDIWFGDVPGLAESLAGAGVPDAAYLRRPVAHRRGAAAAGRRARGDPAQPVARTATTRGRSSAATTRGRASARSTAG